MNFLQPLLLAALPLVALPILIHLINQWRYQTKQWGAMMFLLAANRMNRGFAKIRQWLILAMRTLAIAGLIFAIARPLAGGLLGLTGGGKTDTTIVLVDRSPSMQESGPGGFSKLDTARNHLSDALEKLGSEHWIGIDSVGAKARSFESLEALEAADEDALQQVDGVGEEVAKSILKFFALPGNQRFLTAARDAGLQIQQKASAEGPLSGRVFCFTGGLSALGRDEARRIVEDMGAKTSSSVTKKVTDVVLGEKAGSKAEKAKKLGLATLDEAGFLELIGREG